jgi:hypothetical protein
LLENPLPFPSKERLAKCYGKGGRRVFHGPWITKMGREGEKTCGFDQDLGWSSCNFSPPPNPAERETDTETNTLLPYVEVNHGNTERAFPCTDLSFPFLRLILLYQSLAISLVFFRLYYCRICTKFSAILVPFPFGFYNNR